MATNQTFVDFVTPVPADWLNYVNTTVNESISVKQTGAFGDGVHNDTTAFLAAIATGKNVYVPQGTYNINQTLILNNQHLFGDGQNTSFIRWIGTNVTDTIIYLGALGTVSKVYISFNNADGSSIVTGTETSGQRVCIDVGAGQYPVQRGGGVHQVKFGECGTALFNSSNSNQSCFSAHFFDIECQNFSYAGIEFLSPVRTGNVYSNIYFNAPKWPNITYALCLAGEESESSVDQINIESMTCIQGAFFSGCRALRVGTMHFEECILSTDSSGYIQWRNSAGQIDSLTFYYCNFTTPNLYLIKLGDSTYTGANFNPNTCDYLRIGVLHCKGLNNGNGDNTGIGSYPGFYFIARPAGAAGTMWCQIDAYVWNTFLTDQATYEAFPADPQGNIAQIRTAAGPLTWGSTIPTSGFSPAYWRDTSGIVHQFGTFSVGGNATVTVSYPIPFSNQAFWVNAMPIDTSTSSTYSIRTNPVNASTFQITNTSSTTITGRWASEGI